MAPAARAGSLCSIRDGARHVRVHHAPQPRLSPVTPASIALGEQHVAALSANIGPGPPETHGI